jgi:hypothetical protein
LGKLLIFPRAKASTAPRLRSIRRRRRAFPRRRRDGLLCPGRTASRRRLRPAPHLRAALKGRLAPPGPSPNSLPEPRPALAALGARPVGAVLGGAEPGDAGDSGQGGELAQGGAVHEGDQGLPAVRILPHRRADPPLTGRALRDTRRARQRGAPAGTQGVFQLAHLPAALHRRRVLWRMRHHRWYVCFSRFTKIQ